MTIEFEWTIHASTQELGKFMDEFSSFLRRNNVKTDDVNKLALILDEIITNTISYGMIDNKDLSINIKTNILSNTIQTTIVDDGNAFDPTKQPSPDTTSSLEDRPIGGLGLHLVRSFIDKITYKYENEHNIINLVKKFNLNKDGQMEIVKIIKDNIATLLPKGRIDSNSSNDLDAKIHDLLENGQNNVIIDFTNTDFISSAGLRVLLLRAKQAKVLNGKIVLSNMSSSIAEVFEVSGFSTLFNIYENTDAALKDLT